MRRFICSDASRKRQQLLGLAGLALILLVNSWVLFFYQLPGKNIFWSSLHNAGHALIFLGFALSLCVICHHFLLGTRQWQCISLAVVVSMLFGGMVEIVQSQVGRDASWMDVGRDFVGTMAGSAFYLGMYQRSWKRVLAFVAFLLLLMASLADPAKWRLAEYYRKAALPMLADFDNRWLNLYVKPKYHATLMLTSAPAGWIENKTLVGKVDFHPGSWPGITLEEVYRDWSHFQALSFEVFNPADDVVRLVVRVHDRNHNNRHKDRFNRTYDIAPGLHHFHIALEDVRAAPVGRDMDMHRIESVMFYSYKLKDEETLYFDNITLQ